MRHNNNLKIDYVMVLTTWLLVFSGLTVAAIVIDGLRRMFASHAALKIDIDETLCGLAQEKYPSELPNGGAHFVAAESVCLSKNSHTVEGLSVENVTLEALTLDEITLEEITLEETVLEETSLKEIFIEQAAGEIAVQQLSTAVLVDKIEVKYLKQADIAVFKPDIGESHSSQMPATKHLVSNEHCSTLDLTPVTLSAEEIAALTSNSEMQNLSEDAPAEASLASSNFDPTRPVHEWVETNSMVQSDLFAEQDLTELATIKSDVAHELIETSDNILFSDTGIDDLHAEVTDRNQVKALTEATEEQTLSTRLAKVTSMTFGKKLLSRKRLAAQKATEQAAVDLKFKDVPVVEQVISILVTANDGQGFYGPQLLKLVQACGLVHGEMNIFYRFEDGPRLGKIQFSMANMMEPGTFDLSQIDHLHTPGVVFFLVLPTAQDSMQAFDFMLETAQCLAANLGGEVLDEQRSVMRPQTIEHCRQQVRDFERRNMTRRAQL